MHADDTGSAVSATPLILGRTLIPTLKARRVTAVPDRPQPRPDAVLAHALAADLEGGRGTLIRQALAHLGLLR